MIHAPTTCEHYSSTLVVGKREDKCNLYGESTDGSSNSREGSSSSSKTGRKNYGEKVRTILPERACVVAVSCVYVCMWYVWQYKNSTNAHGTRTADWLTKVSFHLESPKDLVSNANMHKQDSWIVQWPARYC